MKKLFLATLAVTIVLFSTLGCVTKDLWRGTDVTPYPETIIAFYSSPTRDEIIFIGQKYHYIFNQGTTELQMVLKAREFLTLNQKNLNIYSYIEEKDASVIHTGIEIRFEKILLSSKQITWLITHGFSQQDAYVPMFVKSFSLMGKRYRANQKVNSHAIKLKQPIQLQINERSSNTLYKILMTPLTVTADAGLALAGAVVLPIVWIIN